jgi:peptidoglycan-associated lipoprotein
VEPSSIERGQSATLRWAASNVVGVRIESSEGKVMGGCTDADGEAAAAAIRAAMAHEAAVGPAGAATGANAEAAKQELARLQSEASAAAQKAGISLQDAIAGARAIMNGSAMPTSSMARNSLPATGSMQVNPNSTATYTLIVFGPGGVSRQQVTLRVAEPAPPPPPAPAPRISLSERVSKEVADIFYDYDRSDIRESDRAILQRNADALKAIFREIPSGHVLMEGHCDERGSAEYNLGLGDRRSTSARDFLVQLGVPEDRLKTVSYGKERPQCTDSNEECWQKNRRAHFVGVDQ